MNSKKRGRALHDERIEVSDRVLLSLMAAVVWPHISTSVDDLGNAVKDSEKVAARVAEEILTTVETYTEDP